MQIKEALTEENLLQCFEVMKELRPHHTAGSFLITIKQMKKEGYHLLYIEDDGIAVCAAGFRFTTTLYNGLIIDLDDFVTLAAARKKGYAAILFDHIAAIAKEKSIQTIHLNSAHHRNDAHRFYLSKKMNIIAHHFSLTV